MNSSNQTQPKNDGAKNALASFFSKLKNIVRKKEFAPEQQLNLDKKLVYSLTKSRIPKFVQMKYVKKFMTAKELLAVRISLVIIILSLVFVGARFYKQHLKLTPASGGDYREAVVGLPRHINPLYAGSNDVDDDISRLVYSSLVKYDGDGNLVKDLAESYEVGGDGKSYIFRLNKNAKWHDGKEVTTDDVLYTFHTIQDLQFNSSIRKKYVGVGIEKIDDKTVKFSLPESYAPFMELMTFGIMPENLWYQVSAEGMMLTELNIKPVGSGPYKFKSLSKDKNGQLISYTLEANKDYYGGAPKVDTITFKFFPTPDGALDALNNNAVDGVSSLPERLRMNVKAKNSYLFHKLEVDQLTAIFFNKKNNAALSDVKVRQALALALDKDSIVKNVFGESAVSVDGPILPDSPYYKTDLKVYNFNKSEAESLLDDAGWKLTEITQADIDKLNENKNKLKDVDQDRLAMGIGKWRFKDGFLTVKLATVDTDEYNAVAQAIKDAWTGLGIKVVLDSYPTNQMQTDVIGSRNFDALIYGEVVGNDPDVYAFWHSSQIGTNGANIANYVNKEVDQLLEDGRLTLNVEERKQKYFRFQEIIANEVPAIFLFSPVYTYIQDKDIRGYGVTRIQSAADRLNNAADWYMKTTRTLVW